MDHDGPVDDDLAVDDVDAGVHERAVVDVDRGARDRHPPEQGGEQRHPAAAQRHPEPVENLAEERVADDREPHQRDGRFERGPELESLAAERGGRASVGQEARAKTSPAGSVSVATVWGRHCHETRFSRIGPAQPRDLSCGAVENVADKTNGSGPHDPRAAARLKREQMREFRRMVRARHPPFIAALLADARVTSRNRGRPLTDAPAGRVFLEALRLAYESDGFLAQAMYRGKARLQGLGIPVLPRILHRLAILTSGLYIGDPVVIQPGVHLAHGQIVIDGIVEVNRGATIFPFVTIGLKAPSVIGPTIGERATIGSGAKVIGEVTVGAEAKVGANAVVLEDVPAGATVVGVPARRC